MQTVSLLLRMVMMVLLDLTDDVWTLPAPSGVSMESVNMRHVLKWRPLQAQCNTNVLYSVQFQGEFELTVLNDSWVDAHECQWTRQTHCDLTLDLGSDSDYNLRVGARCGSRLSPWTRLSQPFNRRDTFLTAPQMEVTAVGDALQVSFDGLPVTAVVMVTVWKRGEELQTSVHAMPAERTMLHVAALQEGAVYCVRAQTFLHTQLHSSSSDTQCVSITGPDAAWKRPTTLTVAVVMAAAVLVAVFWSVIHCRPDACRTYFHKEPLPRSLQSVSDIKIWRSSEEAEPFETIRVAKSDDFEDLKP